MFRGGPDAPGPPGASFAQFYSSPSSASFIELRIFYRAPYPLSSSVSFRAPYPLSNPVSFIELRIFRHARDAAVQRPPGPRAARRTAPARRPRPLAGGLLAEPPQDHRDAVDNSNSLLREFSLKNSLSRELDPSQGVSLTPRRGSLGRVPAGPQRSK